MRRELGFERSELEAIVGIVTEDTSRVSIALPELVLYDRRSRAGSGTAITRRSRFGGSLRGDGQTLVCRYGEHSFQVDEDEIEAAAAAVIHEVKGDVSRLLGRDWPQIREPSGALISLKPALDHRGAAGWFAGLYQCCALGQLRSTYGDKVRW